MLENLCGDLMEISLKEIKDEERARVLVQLRQLSSTLEERGSHFIELGGFSACLSVLQMTNNDVIKCLCLLIMSLTVHREMTAEAEDRTIGAMSVLAKHLNSGDTKIQILSAYIMAFYCKEAKNSIPALGIFSCLVPLLSSPLYNLQVTITTCLLNCSLNKDNQDALRNSGGFSALLNLVAPSYDQQVRLNSLVALSNYTVNDLNKSEVGKLEGIEILVQLLADPAPAVREKAAGVLWNCASLGDNRKRMAKTNATALLEKLLPENSSEKIKKIIERLIAVSRGQLETRPEDNFKHVIYEVTTFKKHF